MGSESVVVVVIDVMNGDIVVILFLFVFDLNKFVCGILGLDYCELMNYDYCLLVDKMV